MTLSIIILSFNSKDLTINCLKSLQPFYEEELNKDWAEIVVVDNASTDGSVDAVSNFISGKKGMRLVESNENLGFGRGNNLGAKNAKGEILFFLNSDTEVQDNAFIKMTEYLKNHLSIGIMGPKLINFDGSPQPSTANFYNLTNLLIMLLGFEKRKSPDEIIKVDWITGAATMIRKDVFEKIGMFDKEIFMYMEDHELCYRAKKNGFDTYFFPGAFVKHKSVGSSNTSFAIVNIYKNVLYFYKKHKSKAEYLAAKLLLFSKALAVLTLGKITGNSYYVNTYREALRVI